MRAVWKGSVSFGLVNIPVALYPATRREDLKFRQLRERDLSPIHYKRVAEVDGEEVPYDQIVKGYEYEKGQFVVLREEDFQKVNIEATQSVDILDFVDLSQIDPMFFQKPYYLEPQKKGEKAYALLRDTLKETNKTGIAKVVIKTKQYLAALKPKENLLVLELLHFADELVSTEGLNIPRQQEVAKKEITTAKALVDSLTVEWRPERYTDDYKEAVFQLVEEKISGGEHVAVPAQKGRPPTEVVDLVKVLQESLASARKGTPKAERKPTRKRTGSPGRKRKTA
jgi:DNA end-binding protein Ku